MSAVESPTHYTQGYIEVIYTIESVLGKEGFRAFCLGNWIKYKARHEYKNGAEDLAKAEQYLAWATSGLPAPINGRVPRGEPSGAYPTVKVMDISSGSISALLQHEIDILVPDQWTVNSVSVMPGRDTFRITSVLKHRLDGISIHAVIPNASYAAKYADIVHDLIDALKRNHPEGPWQRIK